MCGPSGNCTNGLIGFSSVYVNGGDLAISMVSPFYNKDDGTLVGVLVIEESPCLTLPLLVPLMLTLQLALTLALTLANPNLTQGEPNLRHSAPPEPQTTIGHHQCSRGGPWRDHRGF